MNAPTAIPLTILLALCTAAAADAYSAVGVAEYSQAGTEGTAATGASVTYTHSSGGGHSSPVSSSPTTLTGSEAGSAVPGSSGETSAASTGTGATHCVAAHESEVSPCYGVLPAPSEAPPALSRARSTPPPVNPAVIAASLSGRLVLTPGRITASPSAQTAGLTGAASWFWLEPAPAARSLTISLHGEQVTVSASAASVQWSFGDGTQLLGGPGVPYKSGPVPAGAVRHVYQTRCLPGDQGHDPYVLSSCGPNGYRVQALAVWAISYDASGPVTTSGVLPSRATSTSTAYPVSEERAFLTTATSGGGG
jgi:hypothetical protein